MVNAQILIIPILITFTAPVHQLCSGHQISSRDLEKLNAFGREWLQWIGEELQLREAKSECCQKQNLLLFSSLLFSCVLSLVVVVVVLVKTET